MLNKKIVRISFCFLICVAMLCSSCPIAFASTQYFQVDFSRPQLSGDDFYIEILMYNPSLNRYRVKFIYGVSSVVMTYTDNAYNTESPRVSIDLYPDKIDFQFIEVHAQEITFSKTEIYDDGTFHFYHDFINTTGPSVDGGDLINTDYGGGYSAVAYRVYGDTYSVVDHTDGSGRNTNFAVVYGETNSINQSIAQVINAIAVLAQNDVNILSKLESIVTELNSIGQVTDDILTTVTDLYSLFQSCLEKMDTLIDYTDDIEDLLDSAIGYFMQIEMWCMDLWYESLNHTEELQAINQKLQTIIDILNAGKNEPTLKNPNESLDSAFGDVSDWFGGLDNFGNQLEANKAENQENLNNAKLFLSGVFGVFPPQIIIALVFVAIMILVAKVIGR